MKFLLLQVYLDTVGDPEKYRIKLCERFSSIKFVVSKKADSLYPVVSGASIVAKVIIGFITIYLRRFFTKLKCHQTCLGDKRQSVERMVG